jgi:uncharacterized protein YidB (DUF937 family)
MNNNPLLGQVLGGLFGNAMANRGANDGGGGGLGGLAGGGMGRALGGMALGSVLAGVLRGGGNRQAAPVPGGTHPYANHTALLVMLLPLAMRWVQRNGGINAVLDRFRQKGMGAQAQSWVSTGNNQPVDDGKVQQVIGQDDLREMAQRLGVPEQQVAQAFAEIMPEMVDKLSPQGQVHPQADQVLDAGQKQLEQEIQDVQHRDVHPS